MPLLPISSSRRGSSIANPTLAQPCQAPARPANSRRVYFFLEAAAWDLRTFLTMLASSIRNARVILRKRRVDQDAWRGMPGKAESRWDIPVLDAARTPGTAVCPLDGLLALGEGGVWRAASGQDEHARRMLCCRASGLTLAGAERGDAGKSVTAVTALGGRLNTGPHPISTGRMAFRRRRYIQRAS